ncbi:MAG: HDIG domain-containing protein [Vicinamibacteria bacterium]|nr:HDIG domain-containing protein [Vicinamibacteria bacterium]
MQCMLAGLVLFSIGLSASVGSAQSTPHPSVSQNGPRATSLRELRAREPDPARIEHALAVEASMRQLARLAGGDTEEWGLAGLLHDIDFAATRATPSRHGLVGAKLIEELGFSAAVAQAVAAHDDRAGVPRRAPMDHALYCADRAYWAVRASGLALESASATPAAVVDSLKRKGITNRIDDDLTAACTALGVTLDDLLGISIEAMRVASAPGRSSPVHGEELGKTPSD